LNLKDIQQRALGCALILGLSIAILAIAELVLRMVSSDSTGPASNSATTEFHPKYIFSLKPNLAAEFRRAGVNGGDVITWKTNSQSFRGKSLRRDAAMRVIVYGDSNIQARFSHLEHSFPAKLERYLSDLTSKDVEVINAGVRGHGPDQSLIRLSLDSDTVAPDVAVLHVFADNDLGDLLRNRLFGLEDNRLVPRTDALEQFQALDAQARSTDLVSSLLVVHTLRKVVKRVKRSLKSEQRDNQDEYVARLLEVTQREYSAYVEGGPLILEDHYDIDIALYPEWSSSLTKMALLDAVLAEAQRVATSKGFELFVLIQPSMVDLTHNFESLDYEHLSEFPSYDRERLTSIVEAMCARRKMHCLNLYPIFEANDPERLFFRGNNNHWNDAGQDLAARQTASWLFERLPHE